MISRAKFAALVRKNNGEKRSPICWGVECKNCPLRKKDGADWCCSLGGALLGEEKIIAWAAKCDVANKLELI
jgi:hypothetical protein